VGAVWTGQVGSLSPAERGSICSGQMGSVSAEFTLMSEISKMETLTLRERVKVSLNNLKQKGVVLGRPVGTKEDNIKLLKKYPEVVKYLKMGLSIREVSKLSKVSINTTNKVSKILRDKGGSNSEFQ
jgi:DNA invertase Pin-like site-specific DNA recombinase